MARRRYISTEISIDKVVNQLIADYGDFAGLLYTWMIPHAEDTALLTADYGEILVTVCPWRRDKTEKDIENVVQGMLKLGLLIFCEKDGKKYLAFPPEKFYKYQTYIPQNKREYNITPTNDDECRETPNNTAYPSPSPSPSPSENISTSEQSPDATQNQPDEKTKEPEKPKKPRQIPLFDKTTEQYKLALFMRDCVLKNLPNAKVPEPAPDKLRRWAYDIDLMMRIDCRSPDEIRQLIDWSHRDSFWKANILSPGKLREKWDTLTAHKKRDEEKIRGAPPVQATNFKQRTYSDEMYKKIKSASF